MGHSRRFERDAATSIMTSTSDISLHRVRHCNRDHGRPHPAAVEDSVSSR
jgi:hypothetical protein